MTARKRESPYAKAVERIVIRHIPVGPAFDCDRAMLRSDILRLVARVEREALDKALAALRASCECGVCRAVKKGARRK